jgi:hypothetical protein
MVTLITNDNLFFTKSKCNCGISVNKKNKKSKSLKSLKSLNKSRKTRKNKK